MSVVAKDPASLPVKEKPKKGPLDSVLSLIKRAPKGSPAVGQTPHTVVWSENKWRLLRFAPAVPKYQTPVLLVPSLINRWYILDLGPGRSLIEWLVAQGHEVFCIDWGTPSAEDRFLTWDDIGGRYLGRAVRVAARHNRNGTDTVHVLGYCLGGTLATAYTAAYPEHVASLVDLAAPIDFSCAGIMADWTRTPTFDVPALINGFGNVPWQLMQAAFMALKPTLTAGKVVSILDRAWDDEFLEGFLLTEKWGNDNISFPGACYGKYIEELYRKNALLAGTFTVGGRPALLGNITCPLLMVAFGHDHIVPLPAADAIMSQVRSTDVERVVLDGGHVGAVISRKAAGRLWPALSKFWASRDGRAIEPARARATP